MYITDDIGTKRDFNLDKQHPALVEVVRGLLSLILMVMQSRFKQAVTPKLLLISFYLWIELSVHWVLFKRANMYLEEIFKRSLRKSVMSRLGSSTHLFSFVLVIALLMKHAD